MNPIIVNVSVGGKTVRLETGRMAKLAGGSATVWADGTVVLATAVSAKSMKPGIDFIPLTVDYQERAYAAGKIPGGFFKREGKPSEREVLNSRLIDRPIRPLLPDGYFYETQLVASVISIDKGGVADVMAVIAASTALYLSDVPFHTPIGAVRLGLIDGNYIVNPTLDEQAKSQIDLVVAGTRDAIMMVEGQASEVSEDVFLKGIALAHEAILPIIEAQEKLRSLAGREKRPIPANPIPMDTVSAIRERFGAELDQAMVLSGKQDRQDAVDRIFSKVRETFLPLDTVPTPVQEKDLSNAIHEVERLTLREIVLSKKIRADGRGLTEIRPITIEVGILPRTHGSALFTRG
jgi:polyribonucleotide nucleotidyltransferase